MTRARNAPVALLATALAWAGSACQPPQSPPDSARGFGLYSPGAEEWRFRFEVRTSSVGAGPLGIMSLQRTDGAFSVEAEAFCLAVSGGHAAMVGDIIQTKGFQTYDELVIKVEDSGSAATPDTISHIVMPAGQGQAHCYAQNLAHTVDSGYIEVHDAP